jgi:hypothetical protein
MGGQQTQGPMMPGPTPTPDPNVPSWATPQDMEQARRVQKMLQMQNMLGGTGGPPKPPDSSGELDYSAAAQTVRKKYPILSNVPIKVTKAPGPYEDETYQPWGEDNPDPGNLSIQIRHARPKTQQELENIVTTESMHYLGTRKPSGEPVNPAWWNLKQQFRQAMTPRDMELAKQHWQEEQQQFASTGGKEGDKRSFDDFMNQSYLDMFMRGYMFPQSQGQEWVERQGHWPPAQAKILDQMQTLLRTGNGGR